MKTIVVDLDDTLFKRTWITRFFFWLSKFVYKLGINFERVNPRLLNVLKGFDVKVVLSGRADNWMREATLQQLESLVVQFDEIILCPRGKLYMDWKIRQVERLRKTFKNVVWLDNEIDSNV